MANATYWDTTMPSKPLASDRNPPRATWTTYQISRTRSRIRNVRHQRPWTRRQLRPMAAVRPVFSTNITGSTVTQPTQIHIHSGSKQNITAINPMTTRYPRIAKYRRTTPRSPSHMVTERPSADWHAAPVTATDAYPQQIHLTTVPTH